MKYIKNKLKRFYYNADFIILYFFHMILLYLILFTPFLFIYEGFTTENISVCLFLIITIILIIILGTKQNTYYTKQCYVNVLLNNPEKVMNIIKLTTKNYRCKCTICVDGDNNISYTRSFIKNTENIFYIDIDIKGNSYIDIYGKIIEKLNKKYFKRR